MISTIAGCDARTANGQQPPGPPRHHGGGGRDYDHHDRRDRERRGSSRQETRPPKRSSSGQDDPFWDNRWEAMELQKKADAMVSSTKSFLCFFIFYVKSAANFAVFFVGLFLSAVFEMSLDFLLT